MDSPDAGDIEASADISIVGTRAVRSPPSCVVMTDIVWFSWSMVVLCTAALAELEASKVKEVMSASLLSLPVSLVPLNVTSTGIPLKSMAMLMNIEPSEENMCR